MSVQVTKGGIEVAPASDAPTAGWDALVGRSPHATAFHRRAFLDVVADHLDATLHLLVGYKGQEPVGLFPVFEVTRNLVTTAFSPPPGVEMSQLGPVMLGLDGAKRRRVEKRTHRFVEGCLEWVEDSFDPSYVSVRPHVGYDDHRPFVWNGFDLTPRYTYVVDLRPGPEEVMAAFSSDARRNVRSTDDDAYAIEEEEGEAPDAIDRVVDHLERRHENRGVDYALAPALLHDLARALPDGELRTYVCRVDGSYAGGMIALDDGRTVYRWQGGARPLRDVEVPVNDLLDWRIMADAMDRGRERYDLMGANTPELCEYKSKFGPELAAYAHAERGTRTMRFVSDLYRRFR